MALSKEQQLQLLLLEKEKRRRKSSAQVPPQERTFGQNIKEAGKQTLDLIEAPFQATGEAVRVAREGLPFRLPEAAQNLGIEADNPFVTTQAQPSNIIEEVAGGIQGLTRLGTAAIEGKDPLQEAAAEVQRPKTTATDIALQTLISVPQIVGGAAKIPSATKKAFSAVFGPGKEAAGMKFVKEAADLDLQIAKLTERLPELAQKSAKLKTIGPRLEKRAGRMMGRAEELGGFDVKQLPSVIKEQFASPTGREELANTVAKFAGRTAEELQDLPPKLRNILRKTGEELLERGVGFKLDTAQVQRGVTILGDSLELSFPLFKNARQRFKALKELARQRASSTAQQSAGVRREISKLRTERTALQPELKAAEEAGAARDRLRKRALLGTLGLGGFETLRRTVGQ